jgi:hypothetical protein
MFSSCERVVWKVDTSAKSCQNGRTLGWDEPSLIRTYYKGHIATHLKGKINELAGNSKNKNIRDLYRGINEFKRGYQPRSNLVKDENGDLLVDSNTILNRWKSYCYQLLKFHDVSDIRQCEEFV